MIAQTDIAPRILAKPCEKCGEVIPADRDSILTFSNGEFVRLHTDCVDFIDHATKGPRTLHCVRS